MRFLNTARRGIAAGGVCARPIVLALAALALGSAAWILGFPTSLGICREEPLGEIHKGDGWLLKAPLPDHLTTPGRRTLLPPDRAVVLENGVALPTPASGRNEIAAAGWGRYRFAGAEVFFSTIDGGLPDGKTYTIRTPLFHMPEWLLVPLWAAGFLAAMGALSPWVATHPKHVAASLGLLLAAGMAAFPDSVSTGFFHGLAVPIAWSIAVSLAAKSRGIQGAVLLAGVLAIPMWASFYYYALMGSSHSWFLLGGLLPLSDANMHFCQAVEILHTGQATTGFNGRFLYPLFLASLMGIAGENAHLVNLLSMVLVMGCLGVAVKTALPVTGTVGAALMACLTWCFIRLNGAWLSMTENLGLPLGLLAMGLFVLGSRFDRFTPCAAGLFLFGIGMAARPGALFILPALAGFCVLRFGGGFNQPRRWLTIGAISGVAVLAGMGTNNIASARIYEGTSLAYQNFAFSLNGLLTGSDWSKSHNNGLGNPQEIMEENKRLIRENPLLVAQGAARTLEYLWPRGFFFQFDKETRLVGIGSLMALAGLVALALGKESANQRGWIFAACLGILLSLPFAPPWDAGSRPYAVTMPTVFLLCGIGCHFLLGIASRLGGLRPDPASQPEFTAPADRHPYAGIGIATGIVLLTTFAPLALAGTGGISSATTSADRKLRPGGTLPVQPAHGTASRHLSRQLFLRGLSTLAVNRPELRDRFLSLDEPFTLAVDWNGPKFRVITAPNSSEQVEEFGSLIWDRSSN